MPTPLLEAYAKESGKTVEEAEKCWEKSKHEADGMFKGKEKDGHYWSFVNTATRKCMGLPEHKKK